jgi:glycosyltransferase involved in cell wall biosynthesis
MPRPFFSIITPTLQRDSLLLTVESLDKQTMISWEHIIQVDSTTFERPLIDNIAHGERLISLCREWHSDGGNTCRRLAWKEARGLWTLYLDDDNYLPNPDVLSRIHATICDSPIPVHFFPILRFGNNFFPPDPPRSCHVDTANAIVRTEIAEWPDTDAYGSDGIWIENLISHYPYAMHGHQDPIVVMPKMGGCQK